MKRNIAPCKRLLVAGLIGGTVFLHHGIAFAQKGKSPLMLNEMPGTPANAPSFVNISPDGKSLTLRYNGEDIFEATFPG